MKKLLLCLFLGLGTIANAQTTYFTCTTDGQNSTDPAGTSPACAVSTAWNALGNTLVVQAGHVYTYYNNTINGDIIVQAGGRLDFIGTGNAKLTPEFNASVTIEPGGTMNLVNNTNNQNLELSFNNSLFISGTLNFEGSSTKDSKLILPGTGSGLMEVSGSITTTGLPLGTKVKLDADAGRFVLIKGSANITMTSEFKAINIEIESGAVLNVGKFKVDVGGTADIAGTVNALSGGIYTEAGQVEIKSPTILNGTVSCAGEFKTNDASAAVLGQGTITANTFDLPNNKGSINGLDATAFPGTNVTFDLKLVGFVWDGSTWTVTAGAAEDGVSSPNGPEDWAIFDADYTTGTDGTLNAGGANIKLTITLTFDNDDDLTTFVSVYNTGDLVFVDNAHLSSDFYLAGNTVPGLSGYVTSKRNMGTNLKWYRMGFPVNSGTVGDLVANFPIRDASFPANQQNIFYWDASTSNWVAAATSTALSGNAFVIYTLIANPSVEIKRPNAEFNNDNLDQSFDYDDGTNSSSGFVTGPIDGWNQFYNPFQAFLDADRINNSLVTPDFQQSAVYVWNGSSYTSWNTGGTSAAQWIGPHQAFYVQTDVGASDVFTFQTSMITSTPGAPVAGFTKTTTAGQNVVLNLSGDGKTNATEVVLNDDATTGFDGFFDAYYLSANPDVPVFYTMNPDSVLYSLNQLPLGQIQQPVDLIFSYPIDSKSFTISLDKSLASNVGFVTLEDVHAQTLTNLKSSDYTFMSNTSAPNERFKLHFTSGSVGIVENEDGKNFRVWINENELRFDDLESLIGAKIHVYNLSGQLVTSGTMENSIYIMEPGVYLVNIITKQGHSYTTKIVKM